MKKCELCKSRARIFCDSDQAILCWDCDARVHSANFLVARHTRTLLCHACQSLTPWTASGSNLGRSFCVCESCVTAPHHNNTHDDAQSELSYSDDDDNDNDDDSESTGDDEDDEGENQVVPWTSSPSAPVASLSSVEEEKESVSGRVYAKRPRCNVSDLGSQVNQLCSSPTRQTADREDSVTDTRKSLKQRRIQKSVEEDKSGAIDLNY